MINHNAQTCTGREEMIHHYLDGALPPAEQTEFTHHLVGCAACQTMLAEMESLFASLESWPEVAAPAELVPQVMAHLPAPGQASRYTALGGLALLGQIIIGLGLFWLAQPFLGRPAQTQMVWQTWSQVSEIGFSLNSWGWEVFQGIIAWVQGEWFPPSPWLEGGLSLGLTLTLIFALGLAWLIGNFVLLRTPTTSTNV